MLTVYQISCELVSGDLRPVYSDATQLNSTSSGVELSCVAINGPRRVNESREDAKPLIVLAVKRRR